VKGGGEGYVTRSMATDEERSLSISICREGEDVKEIVLGILYEQKDGFG